MLTLRPYQQAAIASIYGYFEKESGNPLVVIPAAGGKSLVMAAFIDGVLKAWPDQRVLVVTHVRELIAQNHAEMLGLWPEAPAGIYSAAATRGPGSSSPASGRSTTRRRASAMPIWCCFVRRATSAPQCPPSTVNTTGHSLISGGQSDRTLTLQRQPPALPRPLKWISCAPSYPSPRRRAPARPPARSGRTRRRSLSTRMRLQAWKTLPPL